jgi:DNA-binding transcriptional ArsR family regulator
MGGASAMTHRLLLHPARLEILDLHEHRLREYEATLQRIAEQMKEPKVKEK